MLSLTLNEINPIGEYITPYPLSDTGRKVGFLMQFSEQQKQIIESVSENKNNIQVIARAGCGKTTTILAATAVAKGNVAFFAFNKSIAQELAQKAPKNVNVQTIHSLGFQSLRQTYRFMKIDNDKTFNIVKSMIEKTEYELISPIKKLVSLCKNNLTEPTNENLDLLCLEYNVETNDESDRIYSIVRKVLDYSIPNPAQCVIDFDDMIWLPNKFGFKGVPYFDWVFVDEAQDLNRAQQHIMLFAASRGKICFVGDPAQAIYHFRGADSESMNYLKTILENDNRSVTTLSLNFTRRCPKAIVKEAQHFVPDFEYFPEAPEGIVEHKKELEAQPGDMVLCAKNSPLVPIAYRLIRSGIPVKIQGRDIANGLISLIKKLKPISVDDLIAKSQDYLIKEKNKMVNRFKDSPSKMEEAVQLMEDKIETLYCLCDGKTHIDELVSEIQKLFVDVNSAESLILLSTIHKAKGLEAGTVWIVGNKYWGKQANNIQYVAITRAKNRLVYLEEKKK